LTYKIDSSIDWVKPGKPEMAPKLVAVTSSKIFVLKLTPKPDNELGDESGDVSATPDSRSPANSSALFCHDGHKSAVLKSVPHPEFGNLFFSSDARNNLHAWSFKAE
jgi:hypothetical protein